MAKPPINKEWKMTDRKKLFDKPREELEQEFVKTWLRRPGHFWREDTDGWLRELRAVERPNLDQVKGWIEFYDCFIDGKQTPPDPSEMLESCATPMNCATSMIPFAPFFQAINELSPRHEKIRFYPYKDDRHMLVRVKQAEGKNHLYVWFYDGREESWSLRCPHPDWYGVSKCVYRVLLSEWDEHRPKWEAAREYLCCGMAEAIERELAEGAAPSWIDQEYHVQFSAALQGAIYAEQLTAAQREGRILDLGRDAGTIAQVGLDLGLTGAAVIAQSSTRGRWIEVLWSWAWEGRTLPEVIATIRATPYHVGHWIGPHDLEQGSDLGETRLQVASRLGVRFTVVPRVSRVEERIDLVARKFPMVKFDPKGAAPLLEALQHYRRRWNDRLKTFDPEPVHDKHSHLADAFGTLLSGWKAHREPRDPPRPARTAFDLYAFLRGDRR